MEKCETVTTPVEYEVPVEKCDEALRVWKQKWLDGLQIKTA